MSFPNIRVSGRIGLDLLDILVGSGWVRKFGPMYIAARCSDAVYVMGQEKNVAELHCVPPGQMDTKDVQLYEWRTIDNRMIINKPGKIQVDENTGVLKIFNIAYSDSAQLFCSAVLPDEERTTFTHNLIGTIRYDDDDLTCRALEN